MARVEVLDPGDSIEFAIQLNDVWRDFRAGRVKLLVDLTQVDDLEELKKIVYECLPLVEKNDALRLVVLLTPERKARFMFKGIFFKEEDALVALGYS